MSRLLVLQPQRPSRVDLAQTAPLRRHAEALRRGLGLDVAFAAAAEIPELLGQVRRAGPDLVWIQARAIAEQPRERIRQLLSALREEGRRVAWLEAQASSTREDFWLASNVDLIVRRSLLRWREHYGRSLLQGRVHAEAVRRRFDPRSVRRFARGVRLLRGQRAAWRFWQLARLWRSSFAPGSQCFGGRRYPFHAGVALGWNLALADDLAALASVAPEPDRRRDVDLHCRVRASFPQAPAWYVFDRLEALHAAGRLARRWRVVTSAARLESTSYFAELRRSRLVLSPFGWGEICFRDFEAILCGAVLVKPSMRHLETWPDVYRPHETYVPVRWDWSDLEAACRRYLEDESARHEMAVRARERLLVGLEESAFLERCARLLRRTTSSDR